MPATSGHTIVRGKSAGVRRGPAPAGFGVRIRFVPRDSECLIAARAAQGRHVERWRRLAMAATRTDDVAVTNTSKRAFGIYDGRDHRPMLRRRGTQLQEGPRHHNRPPTHLQLRFARSHPGNRVPRTPAQPADRARMQPRPTHDAHRISGSYTLHLATCQQTVAAMLCIVARVQQSERGSRRQVRDPRGDYLSTVDTAEPETCSLLASL